MHREKREAILPYKYKNFDVDMRMDILYEMTIIFYYTLQQYST